MTIYENIENIEFELFKRMMNSDSIKAMEGYNKARLKFKRYRFNMSVSEALQDVDKARKCDTLE